MIPLHLRISGFLSYRDPVDVDFSSFDLACISGSNGAGKSSILDAMTWAIFGQARKRDDSVINTHCPAAEVTFEFTYEGNIYRIQRTKPREKPAMLEFSICAHPKAYTNGSLNRGSWKPLTGNSLRETEALIQRTLRMDYETFTNASFLLQGKADQFAQQRPSERKRVLTSILGLEIWESYRESTMQRRRELEAQVHSIDARLTDINQELSEEDARKTLLAGLEESLASLSQMRKQQEDSLENIRRLVELLAKQKEILENQAQELQNTRGRLETLTNRLEERQRERRGFALQLERAAEIEAAYQSWQKARHDLEHWEEVAVRFREHEKARTAPLMEIETTRATLLLEQQALATMHLSVENDLAEIPVLQKRASEIELAMAEVQSKMERRGAAETELRLLHQKRASAQAENPRLRDEMNELKERIAQLEQAEGVQCPLCGQSLSANDRRTLIEMLTLQGKTLGNRFRENSALLKKFDGEVQTLENELKSLAPADGEMRILARQTDQVSARVSQIEERKADWLAKGTPHLEKVTRQIQENDYAHPAQIQLAQIDLQLKALGYDAAAHDRIRLAELSGRESELDLRKLETARATLGPLEREIAGLEEQVKELEQSLAQQQQAHDKAAADYNAQAGKAPDLDQAERSLYEMQTRENQLRFEVGAARQKVSVLDDLRIRQQSLNKQRQEISRDISYHRTLERAFSKDGVPALLIEQALPEIETQANELLDRLSGGSMSVMFATQRQYKDRSREDLRETLDILISDGAGTRDYEMFSGGEAFRVNFAIRLALSRVLAQRAGARLQTLVIDEGFGSQDAEGRQRLIEAINLVRADFAKILVITHLEELKDAFPTRIEVEKTPRGSVVKVNG